VNRLPDRDLDLGGVGRGTQAQDDAQMQVIAEHADEVLGGALAVLHLDLASLPESLQHRRQTRPCPPRAALEENVRQLGKTDAFGDDRTVKRKRRGRHHGVDGPAAEREQRAFEIVADDLLG